MDRAEAIRQLMAQHATLKAEQAQRLSYWQKRAEFTIPHKAAIASPLTPGANAYREKYDATGMLDASTRSRSTSRARRTRSLSSGSSPPRRPPRNGA